MLSGYNPDDPLYFGCKYAAGSLKQGYMLGGAGYVLSREAVRRFVEVALNDSAICKSKPDGAEDEEIGICLENVNVFAGDSRDAELKGRFFHFDPIHHLMQDHVDNTTYYYPVAGGLDCCSDNAIAFHYMSPEAMHQMEYLVYHLRPYGVDFDKLPLPEKQTLEQLIANKNESDHRKLRKDIVVVKEKGEVDGEKKIKKDNKKN